LAGDVFFFQIIRTTSPTGDVKYDIQADTKESEIDIHLTGDGSITHKSIKPRDTIKIDTGGYLGNIRGLLLKLRHQVKVIGFGDSRGQSGINPRYFFGEKETKYPMALNFSASGAGLGHCKAVIECYLHHVPNLEWVVYATSPRIFNRYYENWGGEGLRGSHTYRADRMGWGEWEKKNTEPVTISELKSGRNYHVGDEVEDKQEDDEFEDEDDRKDAIRGLRRGKYEFEARRVNARKT
jgi:hypothetical protein